jgi:hypothetical protein
MFSLSQILCVLEEKEETCEKLLSLNITVSNNQAFELEAAQVYKAAFLVG